MKNPSPNTTPLNPLKTKTNEDGYSILQGETMAQNPMTEFKDQHTEFDDNVEEKPLSAQDRAHNRSAKHVAANEQSKAERRDYLVWRGKQALRVILPVILAGALTANAIQKATANSNDQNTQEIKQEQVASQPELDNNSTRLIKEKYGDKIELQRIDGIDIKEAVNARSDPYVADPDKGDANNIVTVLQPQHIKANEILVLPKTTNGDALGVSIDAFSEEERAKFQNKLPENCDRLWFYTGEHNEYSSYYNYPQQLNVSAPVGPDTQSVDTSEAGPDAVTPEAKDEN